MRILVAIAVLFTFTFGIFAEASYASAKGDMCAHHQMKHDNSIDDELEHSEQDQNNHDDCCCAHSHSMTTMVTPIKIPSIMKEQKIIVSLDDHYSAKLSGLKRPPRL